MPPFLAELLGQLKSVWSRLDAGQRVVVTAILLGACAGLGAIVWYSGRPDYQTILTAEDPTLFSQATAALDKGNISYKLEGRSILVDARVQQQAHAALFNAGVVGEGGAEADSALSGIVLDSESKAFVLAQKNRRLAESSVRQIAGVQRASVAFSKPKRTPYASEDSENQPRASVVLSLRNGESFRRIARSAIDVVAAALGVPPEYVTVTNAATAETYKINTENGSGLDTGDFYAQQAGRGAELTDQAQRMLARIYPDQAVVSVSVDLDPNWELRKEKIVPDSPMVRSEKVNKSDSSTPPSGGDPSSATPTTTRGGNATKTETRDRDFETDYGSTQKGKFAPDVRKLNVAVVLDEALQLDQAKIDQVTALVKNTVGWNDQRDGSGFSFYIEKFKPLPELPAEGSPGLVGMLKQWGPTIGQVVSVVIVVLFLRGLMRRNSSAGKVSAQPTAAGDSADVKTSQLSPEEATRRMRREIESAIANDPAAISRLLESWLAEQKS